MALTLEHGPIVCVQSEVISPFNFWNCRNIDAFRWSCCCLPDWPPAIVVSCQYGSPRVVYLWLMDNSFRGHYPDGHPGLCGVRVSPTAEWWTVGDREQAISMQRCVPPDRSIQGPPLVSSSSLSDRAPGLWRDLLVETAVANHLNNNNKINNNKKSLSVSFESGFLLCYFSCGIYFILFYCFMSDRFTPKEDHWVVCVYLSAALTYIKMDENSPHPSIVRNDAKIPDSCLARVCRVVTRQWGCNI